MPLPAYFDKDVMEVLEGELLPRVGRKPKYNKKYCDDVIDFALYGKTVSSFCVKYRLSRKTYYEWQKKHPEFAEACGVAKEAYKLFWKEHNMAVAIDATAYKGNHKVLQQMFNTAFDDSAEAKEALDPRSPININLNLENFEKKALTDEERQTKIQELQQKLLEGKRDE